MRFDKIDLSTWPRREIYEYFSGTVMYTTVHLDITDFLERVKARGIRFYPAMIHCIATVANTCPDYRYGLDGDGCPGIWERVDPLYTVPRQETPELFSMTSTPYRKDFGEFYAAFQEDYRRAEACGKLQCGALDAGNYLGVTAMPGLHFSSFSFGDAAGKPDLTPFTVLGGYRRQGGRVTLPVFGEFVHSVNDGHHISQFFTRLAEACRNF